MIQGKTRKTQEAADRLRQERTDSILSDLKTEGEEALKKKRRRLTSPQIVILGFLGVILLGSMLLMLPVSTQSGNGASFMDALFTATSCVCVTGLIVQDTATYWSLFGQVVIILLIQVGGIGVVTAAVAFVSASGRRVSLMQRSTMQDSISAPQLGGIVRMTKFIVKTVFLIEAIGAVLMAIVFCRDFGFLKGAWYGIFHSISAFCNAGFDLMGVRQPFSSLTSYAASPLINIVIMSLIVVGGVGFYTWADIRIHKWHFRKFRMQSKVVIVVSAGLILLPAIYFFFFEFAKMPAAQRFWCSMFQSVTTRTAGFNTADLMKISETGIMLMTVLMLIGGSPGSTAGGMKTTTAAVLFSAASSVFRRKKQSHFFGRAISDSTIRSAAVICLMYIMLCLSSAMIISRIDNVSLVSALFETGSAVGTVGLTQGITPNLSTVSHLILIILMYLGRVGGLTFIYAALNEKPEVAVIYPEENITVG